MAFRKIKDRITEILRFLKPMNIPLHGAYTGFFLILSIFPTLVLLFALLGYTSYGVDEVLALVRGFLPEAFHPMAERLLVGAYEHTSGTVLSVSAVTALWSASRGVRGLLIGLNAVYGIEENRNYFVTRGISTLYTFLFLLVLVLTLVLHVFGNAVADYLRMTTVPFFRFLLDAIDLRLFFLIALQTVLFTAIYAVMPNRHTGIRQSLPGALLTAVGWLAFSDLFSLYVAYFPNYANIYGSVYAAALAMLWLYFCVCILFYGGALNRFLTRSQK